MEIDGHSIAFLALSGIGTVAWGYIRAQATKSAKAEDERHKGHEDNLKEVRLAVNAAASTFELEAKALSDRLRNAELTTERLKAEQEATERLVTQFDQKIMEHLRRQDDILLRISDQINRLDREKKDRSERTTPVPFVGANSGG